MTEGSARANPSGCLDGAVPTTAGPAGPHPSLTQASAMPEWERRFRAVRMSLPEWATEAPGRCIYLSNASGRTEVYSWDRSTGARRRLTDRPAGTSEAAISPDGASVWWFDDTDGDELGVWMRQPFDAGVAEPAAPDVAAGYPAGLALGPAGLAVIGRSDEAGTSIHRVGPGHPAVTLYRHAEDAGVAALSRDGELVAITHSEHGDSRHPALRVLRVADGAAVAELWDGPGRGVEPVEFAPVPGDPRLLVRHERRGRPELLMLDVVTGEQTELVIDLPGEVVAEFYPDAAGLLVTHEHQGRAELHRLDLATGRVEPLGTPAGVVSEATARPDGTVEFRWSSAAWPPVLLATSGETLLEPGGEPAPPSVPVTDAWVPGPGGTIHALVATPAGPGPHPTLFLVHGGPTWHDCDEFSPTVAAWVDAGLAVVRVNYRGSTGYGSAWRDANEARVGLTELEDLAAVRAWAVECGLADSDRCVLAGGSWGGFLTLLGLGTQPELWALGVAAVPVADYVAAYEDEMESLQAFDRALFGGSPEQVPDRYRESSPLSDVDAVRVPVLVLAGENDPRCPIRQIENYLAALAQRGQAHEVYRFDAGHGSLVVDEQVRQMRAELDFCARHLAGVRRIG